MSLTQLIVISLACWQVVTITIHSRLLAKYRCGLVKRGGKVAVLARCGFCQSVWVAGLLTALLLSHWVGEAIVMAFAAARLANLLNDITHSFDRTPKWTCAQQTEEEAAGDGDTTEYV